MLEVHTLTVGPLQENCYLVHDPGTSSALVVDPGAEGDRILARLDDLGVLDNTTTDDPDTAPGDGGVAAILLTHAHMDHVVAVGDVQEATGAPIWLHPADRVFYDRAHESAAKYMQMQADPLPDPDHILEPGPWSRGAFTCEVLHTPGHTPGGCTFVFDDLDGGPKAFVGDVLFAQGIGRTDFGGDQATLLTTIRETLFDLPDETVVLPGHGPPTTIGHEKKWNPFLQ